MKNIGKELEGEDFFHDFPQDNSKKFSIPSFSFGKNARRVYIGAGIVLLLVVVLLAIPLFGVYNSAKALSSSARELSQAAQEQDLDKIKSSLAKTKGDLRSFDRSLTFLVWTRFIPYFGGYWVDAKSAAGAGIAGVEVGEILIPTIEPYADILGFDGKEQATSGAETAEDRINFVVETIGDITPKLGDISQKTQVMVTHINRIDPNRYPEHFRGKPVRSKLKEGITLVNQMHDFVSGGKPLLEQAPYLLGIDGERTYLFLWQNDKELRPTGGFITAYSIVKVKDGKFEPVASDDIYHLDDRFRSRIPAPDPIKDYLPLVPYWYLRDMNLSPDFSLSMDTFSEHYAETPGSVEVDGIIAVDTQVLVSLLEVLGPIGVPGFGNYSAEEDSRCNCPQVIYELESFADVAGPIVWDPVSGEIVYKPPFADDRKAFLGPFMNSLLANALGQPKDKVPQLFNVAWSSLREKHVLTYFHQEEVQKAAEAFGIAGRIKDYDGDYLHINDTNFAGAKSNLYVQHEVNLEVKPEKDGTTNTLTIKYTNPQEHDGWLNGPFRDWFRIYVPEGSQLLDSTGSDVPVKSYEEMGKTVFEGFFILRPLGVLELKFKYKTPVKQDGGYKIYVQKQPGTEGHQYSVAVGKKKEEFKLTTDKELIF